MREVERARMGAEDVRAAAIAAAASPYSRPDGVRHHNILGWVPRHRALTWRELAARRSYMCEELVGGIEEVTDALEHARANARDAFRDPSANHHAELRIASLRMSCAIGGLRGEVTRTRSREAAIGPGEV